MRKKQAKSAKKTAKSAPKKKAMEQQTHGKEEPKEFKPTTLDQLWGDTGLSKYGTMDVESYQKEVDEMNKTDLQAHANKLGILPIGDRNRLTKKLMAEFKLYISSFQAPLSDKQNTEMSDEMKKILSEGR